MTRPDLYRVGGMTSPGLGQVRRGKDIQVDGYDQVIVGTGGVSAFSRPQPGWDVKKTWVLPADALMKDNLEAMNDHGEHWLIAPTKTLSFAEYVDSLKPLEQGSCKYDTYSKVDEPAHPFHRSKAVRFVSSALSEVYQNRTPIDGWDENDYAFVSVLAVELSAGKVDLDSLAWREVEQPTTKAQRFAVEAVVAHMRAEQKQADDTGDEDVLVDLINDHALLRVALNLDPDITENMLPV